MNACSVRGGLLIFRMLGRNRTYKSYQTRLPLALASLPICTLKWDVVTKDQGMP